MKKEQLVFYGIKAPSGHNSQPWKFFTGENYIEIYPDFNFALPVVDPEHRELYISLGCAGENICAAAAFFGYKAEWSLKTNPEGIHFIRIDLEEIATSSSKNIIKLIELRQSNRNYYNGKLIEDEQIEIIRKIPGEKNVNIHFYKKGTPGFNTISAFIQKGNAIQMSDNRFKDELLSWIRFNKKQVEKTRNGLTYKVMGSPSMPKMLGKLIVKSFLKPKKQNKSDLGKINSSSHFILLTTKTNSIAEWLALGFYLERVLLQLTEMGIANAYLNPPCEITTLADDLRKQLPIDNEFPTIIMRIGFVDKKTPYSPRRNIDQVSI